MLIKILEKLGATPQQSLKHFLQGLALFALAMVFIAIGYFYQPLWQVFGLILLFLACLVSFWGYLGIFANRWLHILNKR